MGTCDDFDADTVRFLTGDFEASTTGARGDTDGSLFSLAGGTRGDVAPDGRLLLESLLSDVEMLRERRGDPRPVGTLLFGSAGIDLGARLGLTDILLLLIIVTLIH